MAAFKLFWSGLGLFGGGEGVLTVFLLIVWLVGFWVVFVFFFVCFSKVRDNDTVVSTAVKKTKIFTFL